MNYLRATATLHRMYVLIFLALLAVPFLLSCSPSAAYEPSDLEVANVVSTIGRRDDNRDLQLVSYEVTLANHGTREIYVRWVEPLLTDEVLAMAVEEDRRVSVDKTILPGGFLEVPGQYNLNTFGVPKYDIETGVAGFSVSSEEPILFHRASSGQG